MPVEHAKKLRVQAGGRTFEADVFVTPRYHMTAIYCWSPKIFVCDCSEAEAMKKFEREVEAKCNRGDGQ